MSKIRINELARELEVKPNVILDLLPQLGFHEKKTHSSSLDDEAALAVRRHLAGANGGVVVAHAEPAPAPEPVHEAPPAAPQQPAAPAVRAEEPPVEQVAKEVV